MTYSRHVAESFEMHIYNKDGSEAEMCGNAIRCVAKLLHEEGRTEAHSLRIHTGAGLLTVDLLFDEEKEVTGACVEMGIPEVIETPEMVEGVEGYVASMGNPHFVILSQEDFPLETKGPLLEQSCRFPEGTNVEVIRPIDQHTLEMRVWERGSGETWACGTGSCATGVAACLNGFANKNEDIVVHLRGGDLTIRYTDETVFMTGAATTVFKGEIEI